jgi:hypothetical protein
VLVFDATAIVAMFHSHPIVHTLWEAADAGRQQIGLPVLAVVEAGTILETTPTSWDLILSPETVTVLPLMERAGVEIAGWPGTPTARHALWEARHMDCPLVTCEPGLYVPGAADVRAV